MSNIQLQNIEERFAPEKIENENSTGRLVVTDGDINIFRLIHEYRFLRCDHLASLTGRSAKRLHRRIFRLRRHGYLTSIRLPQQKHIYALGKASFPVLLERGIAFPEQITERLRVHELKELFLKHEMMIVDFHAVLSLATRENTLKLVNWEEGRGIYDSVTVADNGSVNKLPVRPDAFFTLEDSRRQLGANRSHYFLEADRSTTTQTRFREKLRAYWHYLEQGLHAQKFGIRSFRSLTVTLTEARAKNLCELAASQLPERAKKYFFFTSVENFSLENPTPILERIYHSPRSFASVARHSLVASPSLPQVEAR